MKRLSRHGKGLRSAFTDAGNACKKCWNNLFGGKGTASKTTETILDAFEEAAKGGKHAGFYKNYLDKSSEELKAGIQSLQKQIEIHQDKIANPLKYIPDFLKLDPRNKAI